MDVSLIVIADVSNDTSQARHFVECWASIARQQSHQLEVLLIDPGQSGLFDDLKKSSPESFVSPAPELPATKTSMLQTAINRARGEIVGFLHTDSILEPRGLNVVRDVFTTYPDVKWITGKPHGIGRNGGSWSYSSVAHAQRWNLDLLLDPLTLEGEHWLRLMPESVYFRKSLWIEAGQLIPQEFKAASEFSLWLTLMLHADLHSVDAVLGRAREPLKDENFKTHRAEFLSEALRAIDSYAHSPLASTRRKIAPPPVIRYPLCLNDAPKQESNSVLTDNPDTYRVAFDQRYPKISVVTVSYNQAAFLEKCLDSVLSQRYPNLEYIVLDGGSSDGSQAVLERLSPHLSYWRSSADDGQYAALNEGFARSTGQIMTWINSDDILCPGSLHAVASVFLSNQNISWLTGIPNAISEAGEQLWVFSRLPLYSRESHIFTTYKDPFIQQEGTFWTRSLWEAAGGALDERYQLAADLDLWRRFFRFAQLYSVSRCLGSFRIQQNQRSALYYHHYVLEGDKIIAEELERYHAGVDQVLPPAPQPVLVPYDDSVSCALP